MPNKGSCGITYEFADLLLQALLKGDVYRPHVKVGVIKWKEEGSV